MSLPYTGKSGHFGKNLPLETLKCDYRFGKFHGETMIFEKIRGYLLILVFSELRPEHLRVFFGKRLRYVMF